MPDPTVQRIAPKLISALDRAVNFCQATLAFGRAQERPPAPRAFDLSETVLELRDLLALGDDERITFITDVPEPMQVRADPDHMLRVLLNLSRNAIEAMRLSSPEGGTLRIAALRRADSIEIEVSDTGPGIPPEMRDRLFKAFSTAARRGGTGLGLAIASELMRAQGGKVQLVDSHRGATFRVTLPV